MTNQPVNIGSSGKIRSIRFALMSGFDATGQPVYARGTVRSSEECALLQSILEPLRPVLHSISSVTMGEIAISWQDGSADTLKPVFHPSSDRYGDLFFVDELQYPMPAELAALLERWRLNHD
jgi:hypothetical protein